VPALEVFDPSGATEITKLHAARLNGVDGKTIALLSDDMWQSHRMLPLIKERLEAQYPNITVIPETEFPMGSRAIDDEAVADMMVAKGVDGVVVGNAS
jgi:hypothetical protein